jgi:gamma-glutamyltranspeptidase/glutathione hydrolase
VAGAISGWAKAREIAPGTLPLSRLLAEAIAYARDGVSVTAGGAACRGQKRRTARSTRRLCRYLRARGPPLLEGERLRQPALARTLERLAQEGLDSFYRGELAVDIASDLAMLGSPVSAADLAAHRAETEPLSVQVKGATLFNHQPPRRVSPAC